MDSFQSGRCRSLRGQVAAEYLATYGWALFAMFVVIAALVTSGLLGPGRFSGEECTFAPNLPCNGFYAARTPNPNEVEVNFNLTNTQGFPIYIQNCVFRLNGGGSITMSDDLACGEYVAQGDWVTYNSILLPSNSRVTPNEMRTIYVTLGFKNCQDAVGATLGERKADCHNDNVRFPLHITSGKLLMQVRG